MPRWIAQFVLAVALLCGGCATQNKFAAPQLTPFRLALCEDYPEETRSLANVRADLRLLETNHITALRVAMGWDGIEPRRGEFHWQFWDEFVNAANERGIQLIPYVCYTPDWAARTNHDSWKQPPRDLADFGRFMETIAARYRGRIHSWEIWNEPDNSAYWAGSVEDFAELLCVGSGAVRKADPNVRVVSGGLAWDISFLDRLVEIPGVLDSVDVINLHNYFETWAPDPVEDIDDYISSVDRMLRRAGGKKELWLAEVGYSSFRPSENISEAYTATYDFEHSAQFQAASVFRMLIPALASGKISTIAWYRINDLPGSETVIGDANNRHLGILDAQRLPKPSLHALQFFQQLFGNAVAPADELVRVETSLASDAETHAFVNAHGELIIVTWLKLLTPRTPFSENGELKDSRRERLSFKLPNNFKTPAVFDATGKPLKNRTVGKENKFEITLHSGEVLVLVAPMNVRDD